MTNLWKQELAGGTLEQLTPARVPITVRCPIRTGDGIYFVSGKVTGALMAYNIKTGVAKEIVSELSTQPIISPDGKHVCM